MEIVVSSGFEFENGVPSQGHPIDAVDQNQQTPLFCAAEAGRYEARVTGPKSHHFKSHLRPEESAKGSGFDKI